MRVRVSIRIMVRGVVDVPVGGDAGRLARPKARRGRSK